VPTEKASIGQPFPVGDVDARIDGITPVPTYADGSQPDANMRVIEVRFAIFNPAPHSIEVSDNFYAYAELGDGSDTMGMGLTFYPLDSNFAVDGFSLGRGRTLYARFDTEIPATSEPTSLVVLGPADTSRVRIPL